MGEAVVKKKVVRTKIKKKRSKKARFFRFIFFLLIVGGIIGFLFYFPSCSFMDTMTKGFSTRYSFASQYEASSKYEKNGYLDKISINWRDGDVKVYTTDDDKISIVESPNKTVTEKFMMHYNYQETDKYGNTLLIQYCKAGKWNFGDLKKDLVVYIPKKENMNVNIHTYNGNINFDLGDLKMDKIQIQSNHGSVDGIFDSAKTAIMLGSNSKSVDSSYHFNIKQTGTVSDFRCSSCQKMSLDLNIVKSLEAGSVYNDLILTLNDVNRSDLSNSRGSIYLYIKEDSNYYISIKNKEGQASVTNNICEKVDELNYKTGSGSNKINIETNSKITIDKIVEE